MANLNPVEMSLVLVILGVAPGCRASVPGAIRTGGIGKSESHMATPAPYFGERGPRSPVNVARGDKLFWTRWEFESIPPDRFLLLGGDDELDARDRSDDQLDQYVVPGAAPYDAPGRQHHLHIDPDLLLHRYDFAGLGLLVYESRFEVTVRVAAPPLADETAESFVRRVMGTLIRRPYDWHFFPTSAPDESLRFSTDARAPGELFGQEGVFGAIVPGGLYFTLCRREGGQMPFPRPLIGIALRKTWERAHPNGSPAQP